jgi:hypothetical protein
MKKLLTITGIFNDFFTNYEDKEDSVSMIVDDEEDCTCYKENGRCLIHLPPKGYVLTDIEED